MWRNHRGHSTEGPEEIQIAQPGLRVRRRSTYVANVGSVRDLPFEPDEQRQMGDDVTNNDGETEL